MSSPKRTVILSSEAQDDFIDIRMYTQQEWGEAQRDRYEAALLRAIAALVDFPEVGVRVPRLFPGCRVRPVERHGLYYRILDDVIEVVRILHERADPTRHFTS
ncbi:MAG: type II toxin-antitoxin system RelE/ParE family toxin [Thermomicrobiales bacterium]